MWDTSLGTFMVQKQTKPQAKKNCLFFFRYLKINGDMWKMALI